MKNYDGKKIPEWLENFTSDPRMRNAIMYSELFSCAEDLQGYSMLKLLRIRNVGAKGVANFKKFLESIGIFLLDDTQQRGIAYRLAVIKQSLLCEYERIEDSKRRIFELNEEFDRTSGELYNPKKREDKPEKKCITTTKSLLETKAFRDLPNG